MRIIAGEFRGRSLLSPPSDKTRPITDRAKQSLFDNLINSVDLEGARVLDCFCGTGSMGLECLSRGSNQAIFVERDRGALGNLKQNLALLQLTDRGTVLPIDAYGAGTAQAMAQDGRFRVAFVDPPYAHMESGQWRQKVDRLVANLAAQAMEPEGLIILRHHTRVSVDETALGVRVVRELQFGDMGITWLCPA